MISQFAEVWHYDIRDKVYVSSYICWLLMLAMIYDASSYSKFSAVQKGDFIQTDSRKMFRQLELKLDWIIFLPFCVYKNK